jgi:hypothetical protein
MSSDDELDLGRVLATRRRKVFDSIPLLEVLRLEFPTMAVGSKCRELESFVNDMGTISIRRPGRFVAEDCLVVIDPDEVSTLTVLSSVPERKCRARAWRHRDHDSRDPGPRAVGRVDFNPSVGKTGWAR